MIARPYKTWVEVSAGALRANAAALKRAAGKGVKLMAVVKANAYGHGTAAAANAFDKSEVDWFGVDSLREAEALRKAGSKKPILILGYVTLTELPRAVKAGFSITTYNLETVKAAAKSATRARPAKLHLKIETGTSRQGIADRDLGAFAKLVKSLKNVQVEGVSTHYANIEDTTDSLYAMSQLARFEDALAELRKYGIVPPLPHTAASAAAILFPQTHFAMVRAGIALYGLWPSKETRVSANAIGRRLNLRPALTWKSIVAQVKTLESGTPVSYGLTERVTRRSKVAIVPVGYWDGYDRGLSSIGRVLVRGRVAKVLGRVCMNMFVVDVTDIPGVRPENEVVLIGRQRDLEITAEEVAAAAGTINYEIIARINPEIPRVLVK